MRLTSPGLMSALKKLNKDNLKSSARIQERSTVSAQPGAAESVNWTDRIPSPLKCRVSVPQASDQSRLQASQVDFNGAYWIVFENGADVQRTDRFVITTELGAILTVYPVGGTFPRDGEVMRKVLCHERP